MHEISGHYIYIYVLPSGTLAKNQGLTPLQHAPGDSTTSGEHGKQTAKIQRKIKASKPEQSWNKICFWTIFGNHTRTIKKNDPKLETIISNEQKNLTTQPCQSEQFWMQTTIQKFLYISTCPGFLDESTMLKLIGWETSQAAMKMVLASICNLQHRDSSGHFGPF